MYKKFLSLIVASVFPTAIMAAPNISLYGVVDGAIAVKKAKGESAKVQFDNGIWAGSRFGIKGNEDLGNGYGINFVLEQGFKLFNGAEMSAGRAFARQSNLALTSKYGQVAFGRMGGLSSDCGTYSILHGSSLWTSYYNNGNIYGTFILSDRYDNVVTYKTPSIDGSTITFMYSNGISGDDNKWSHNQHYYGIGYDFSSDKAMFSVIWEMYDNKYSELPAKSSQVFTMGGSYNFGPATLYGAYQFALHAYRLPDYVRPDNMGSKGANQHSFSASVGFPIAGGELKFQGNLGVGKLKDVSEGEDNYTLWSAATAYEYPISKRTLFYSYAGYGKGAKLVRETPNYNSWTVSVGLSHSF